MRLTLAAAVALAPVLVAVSAAPALAGGGGRGGVISNDGRVTAFADGPGAKGSAGGSGGGGGDVYCQVTTDGDDYGRPGESLWTCWNATTNVQTSNQWLKDGTAPANQVTPEEAAQRVVNSMQLQPITIGVNRWHKNSQGVQDIRREYGFRGGTWEGLDPDALGWGLVGLPVVFSVNNPTPSTWGPMSVSAAAAGFQVQVTATVNKVTYYPGDDSGNSVTCTDVGNPNVQFTRDAGGSYQVPHCGYRYLTTSDRRPGKVFTVTAVTDWTAHWTIQGRSGDIPISRTSTTKIAMGESQAIRE